MTNCNQIWGILLHVMHRSSAAATITTSIHARLQSCSLHIIQRHVNYPRHSRRMWVRPPNPPADFHFWRMTVPLRCLSLLFVAAVQLLCSLTSPPPPDHCFVPTLCPVESLAPTFSNHNYIPAERRQQRSKDRHGMKGKGVTITDNLLPLTRCCIQH